MNFFNVDKEVITEAGKVQSEENVSTILEDINEQLRQEKVEQIVLKEDAPSISEIDKQVVSDNHENIEDLPPVEEKVTHKHPAVCS